MYNEDKTPRADIGRVVRIAVFAAIGVLIFGIVGNQSVKLLLNVEEFGEFVTKPLYYWTLSGLILAAIILVRVDLIVRCSLTSYAMKRLRDFLTRVDCGSRR